MCGAAIFPVGAALAWIAMREPAVARAAPMAAGIVVLIAGVLQFSGWKARQLACWRSALEHRGGSRTGQGVAAACRDGVRLAIHCMRCSLGPTAVLLVTGVMDLRAMAIVGAAITVERLAPAGERAARVIGAVAIGVGLLLLAR